MPLYYPPSQNAIQKTLGATLSSGVTSAVTLNNITGVQNKPGVIVIDRINTNNVETPSVREYIAFTGTSGSTLTGLTRNVDTSGTDQDHAVGAIVEFIPDVVWAEAINTALSNIVDTTTLAVDLTKVVVTTKPRFTLGSDASGDLYYHNAGASLSRLALGTADQVLSANASQPVWVSRPNSGWVTVASHASLMSLDFKLGTKFWAQITPGPIKAFAPSNASISQVALLRVNYASTASFPMNIFTINATISWPLGSSLPLPTAILGKADVFGFQCIASLPQFDGFVLGQNIG